MNIAITAFAAFNLIVVGWIFYIAIMRLKDIRKTLHPIAKIVAYYGLVLGLTIDVALNLLFSILLLDAPREFLLTSKLKRLKKAGGWRVPIADWICERWLNQFDPGHC